MSQSKFVILRHESGRGLDRSEFDQTIPDRIGSAHFDWMFQIDGRLRTWATQTIDRFDTWVRLDADRLADHRVAYLDYQGDLSNDRGTVARVLAGSYMVAEDREDRFVAQMSWSIQGQSHSGFAICQRIIVDSDASFADLRSTWSLSFSPGRYDTNR